MFTLIDKYKIFNFRSIYDFFIKKIKMVDKIIDDLFISFECKFINSPKTFIYYFNKDGFLNRILRSNFFVALIFVFRSINSRNLGPNLLLIISVVFVLFTSNDTVKNMFLSIFAACIFDLIVIRVPDEIKKIKSFYSLDELLKELDIIHDAIFESLNLNLETCIDRKNAISLSESITREIQVPLPDEFSYPCFKKLVYQGYLRDYGHKFNPLDRNNIICFYYKCAYLICKDILSIDQIKNYPELEKSIDSLSKKMLVSRHELDHILTPYNLQLHLESNSLGFVSTFLLNLQSIEYWSVKNLRRYKATSNLRRRFSKDAVKLHRMNTGFIFYKDVNGEFNIMHTT
ncbi:hypothetical protein [Vibrio parahaemolyticus]